MKIEELKSELEDVLRGDEDILKRTIEEINSLNGSFENLRFYENDEDFFNEFFCNSPAEAVRASYYGDYKYMDEYVRFDGYGNLESMDKYEMIQKMQDYIDDVIESIIENYHRLSLSDDINILIEEYEESESDE